MLTLSLLLEVPVVVREADTEVLAVCDCVSAAVADPVTELVTLTVAEREAVFVCDALLLYVLRGVAVTELLMVLETVFDFELVTLGLTLEEWLPDALILTELDFEGEDDLEPDPDGETTVADGVGVKAASSRASSGALEGLHPLWSALDR
jgi:hypothetical protein